MKKLIIILIVTALGSFLGMAYAHIDFMKITDEVLNEYELMEALYILSELDHGSYLIFGTILGGIYGLILITISIGLYVFVSRFFKILKNQN